MKSLRKIRYLAGRTVDVYSQLGVRGILIAGSQYVRHGTLKNDIIGMLPLTEQAIQLNIKLNRVARPEGYTDSNPFKILWISPAEIEFDVRHPDPPKKFGRVYGGDWDMTGDRFTERRVYQSLENYFCNDISWSDTEYYNHKQNRLKDNKPTRGCSDISDLEQYFNEIDELYTKMSEYGYKTQQQLLSEEPNKTVRKNLDAPIPRMNEIGVSIGRDGTFYHHSQGVHRLSLAKILDVNKVAVQVIVRHKNWQHLRNYIRTTGSIPQSIHLSDINLHHPDLADLPIKFVN